MDKEDFQAWKTSQATQWVIKELTDQTAQWEADCKSQLFQASAQPGWEQLQVQAAYLKGRCDGVNLIREMEFEDHEQDQSQSD